MQFQVPQGSVHYAERKEGEMVYQVVSVRRSKGSNFPEGSFDDESTARSSLIALQSDEDCLVAEIQEWPTGGFAPKQIPVLAQYERRNGNWVEVIGELRCRTFGGEARAILAGG